MSEDDSRTDAATEETGLVEGDHPRSFKIHSLRPEFNKANHEIYVAYLRDELAKPARMSKVLDASEIGAEVRPRNVALTGSYGSGKSSILNKVVEEFEARVVSVSLSTLGSEETLAEENAANSDPLTTPAITNAIQKEIVKQLLYREKPSNVPGSRYRRIESFRKGRAFGFSLLISACLTAIAFLTGATSRVETLFGNEVVPTLVIYASVFVLVVSLANGLQLLLHNRVWIEKLTSGPASISLSNKSESFFDKYLDEIVYFFEANTYDIVVFEDLDRFNDPYIFETLRELNTLLNNSKQIDPKVITFVYAIKDSIFEQLGKLSINGVQLTADELRQLAVTNRTKFFDVVIPVVPFISHRNARDLISKEMKSSGFQIDKPLLDLVSKHMVDMRLIKNVHNEFGVFEQKILGPGHLDDLKPQPLFAMVVYKNLNMADFEKVKEGNSKLDDVYADFRVLVNKQIASADREIRQSQMKVQKINSIDSRSEELGDRLEEQVSRLLRAADQSIENATLSLAVATTTAELRGREFWDTWLNDDALVLTVGYQTVVSLNYYGPQAVPQKFRLSLDDVRAALGDPLSPDEWESANEKQHRTKIEESTTLRDFLRTATMKLLAERDELTLKTEHGTESFAEIAERHLGQGLALELVKAGHIDRNFSLYVSMYYDDTVTARARNYILHSVEARAVDINVEIGTGPQIDAMIDEVGDTIFAERSIYNIQLLNHLLERNDSRLDRSMKLIASEGDREREIRTAYFSGGNQVEAFASRLAPLWPDVLNFLVGDESVAEGERIGLIDAALRSIADKVTYRTEPVIGKFIRSNYLNLRVLTEPTPIRSLESVVAVLKQAKVKFESLAALSDELKTAAAENSLYKFTADNLTVALNGEKNLSLDRIRSTNKNVFKFVAENLKAYMEIQQDSVSTDHTIDDHRTFIPILNQLADRKLEDLQAVVQGASSVTVITITALDERLWPVVAQNKSLKANYANLSEYIMRRGGIDEELAETLNASTAIVDLEPADEPSRIALALAIVRSGLIDVKNRVSLSKSVKLASPLPTSELQLPDQDPGLTGALLAAGLIEDTSASYDALIAAGWPVKRAFIQNSSAFATFVRKVELSKADFASISQDPTVPENVKTEIVLNLDAFTSSLTKPAIDSLARFAAEGALAIGPANLLAIAVAGGAPNSLIRLISLEIDALGIDSLLAILRIMPEPYRRLAAAGGHTKIPNTPGDLRLADYLIAMGQVSSRDRDPAGSTIKVNLKRKL